MVMLIAKMLVMKIQQSVTTVSVIQKLSSLARMEDVYRNYGCVILTMIVVMIRMNQLINVGNASAQMAGRDVQARQITGVFQNGCSVMGKMTAAMVVMNFLKIVPSAMKQEISSVPITTVVSRNVGCVILKMIVEIIVMKVKLFAVALTENVLNLNSGVTTTSVFLTDGGVTMMMTVVMVVMNLTALASHVKMAHSSVLVVIVLPHISDVMVTEIVETCQMKWIVLHGIQNGRYCPESKFQCKNHLCILQGDLCDGADDCGDNSDESPEQCSNFHCDTQRRFQCENHRCIPKYQLCDGQDNCGDGSDENNMTICKHQSKSCDPYLEFKCANKECIALSMVCDYADDCGDSSDELGCHHNKVCLDATRGGCEHQCHNLTGDAGGYICTCFNGYVISPENRQKCVDVDECATGTHRCSQLCTNLNGTYQCSCREGFALSDGGVCKTLAEDMAETTIIYSTGPEIRAYGLLSRREADVIPDEKRIEAIDFNPKLEMVFWADSHDRTIKRSYMLNAQNGNAKIGFAQDLNIKGIFSFLN